MSESDEHEFTLGVGKLVGLFFVLVIFCAVCFAIGYGFGRSGAKPPTPVAEVQAAATNASAKPVAAQPSDASAHGDCAAGENCPQTGTSGAHDLSFYKAVEQKETSAHLAMPPKPIPPPAKPAPPPAAAPANSSAIASGIMVQVAAVSRREDAEVLRDALRRKQYRVIIATAPSDRLFHVQIGPFGDAKDAESTRSRLQGDGYNPILKK
jgi:DedD protein